MPNERPTIGTEERWTKWPLLDRLFNDEEAWHRTMHRVQEEIEVAQMPDVRWRCPGDIAEDIICTVAAALETDRDSLAERVRALQAALRRADELVDLLLHHSDRALPRSQPGEAVPYRGPDGRSQPGTMGNTVVDAPSGEQLEINRILEAARLYNRVRGPRASPTDDTREGR